MIKGTVNDNKIKSISEIMFDGQEFTLGENTTQILDALNNSTVKVELDKDSNGNVKQDSTKKMLKLTTTQTVGGNYKKSRRNRNKRRKTNKRTP